MRTIFDGLVEEFRAWHLFEQQAGNSPQRDLRDLPRPARPGYGPGGGFGAADSGTGGLRTPEYDGPEYGTPGYGAAGHGAAGYGPPEYGIPEYGTAEYGPQEYGAPEYGPPEYGSPWYGIPEHGAPEFDRAGQRGRDERRVPRRGGPR